MRLSLRAPGPRCTFLAAAGITLLTRLPLLSTMSYGADGDAWRIVAAGAHLAEQGAYVVSRFPGYPLAELSAAVLWTLGLDSPLAFGLVTALWSALGAGALALLLRSWDVRYPVTGAVGAAMVPVVYIQSVSAMDYVPAAALGIGALVLARHGRRALGGAALGLAVGFRPTAVLMFVPAAILVLRETGDYTAVIRLALTGAAVAVLSWLPVLMTYGIDFVHAATAPVPPADVLRTASLGVWGLLGLAALAFALVHITRRNAERRATEILALSSGIFLFAVLFLAMPYEAGYLIPAVPLTVALIGVLVSARKFLPICLLLIASPLVLDLKADRDITVVEPGAVEVADGILLTVAGPLFHHRAESRHAARRGAEILTAADGLPEGSVIAAGGMLPFVTVTALKRAAFPPAVLTYSWPPRTDPMGRTGDAAWLPPPPEEPFAVYCPDPAFVHPDFECLPLPGSTGAGYPME